MSHTKTFKITPTCFDHRVIICENKHVLRGSYLSVSDTYNVKVIDIVIF
jgi:hypothetical protein